MLRYFNLEPSFKLRQCRARELFGSKLAVTTREFELRISLIQVLEFDQPIKAYVLVGQVITSCTRDLQFKP